jgi:tetratricopeptide (TPR) repeat protein
MADQETYDVFLSHNSQEKPQVEALAYRLSERGLTPFLDKWCLVPGDPWQEVIEEALQASASCAVFIGPGDISPWHNKEMRAALIRQARERTFRVIPVLLPGATRPDERDLPPFLELFTWVDFRAGLEDKYAFHCLCCGIQGIAPGPPPTEIKAERDTGALPPIWNLPHLRNPNFTGREDLLTRLRQALTSGQPAALTQAIHGLGGVGKTQLAVEYAYRHAADYELVWWVRAEEPAALAADYAALAGPLDLPEKDEPDQRLVVQAVRRWLGQHDGWLLVFDNARRPEDLRPYLPPGGAGHVLVTSRNPHWRALASPLTVQVMERTESVAFLLKRTGQTDEAAAGQLAAALGDLPLPLAQAGAYVSQTGTTFPAYLDLFQTRRTELWEKERPPLDYPATVATTWDLAFQQVQRASPAGADLLNLCAFLAPDDISQDLLRGGAQHLPPPLAEAVADPLRFDQAVAALLQYSLLERTGDALSIHRMVQAVARDRLAEEAHQTWAGAAVRIVADAFPSGNEPQDVRIWPVCARLLPHALEAAGYAEALGVASEATGRLLNQAGTYLWGRAEFAQAKAAYERALATCEQSLGSEHPCVATAVNNLGGVLQALGDLAGARVALERALAIDEAAFGPHHSKVALRLWNLGTVLQEQGEIQSAREAYQRALATFEHFLGPDHPRTRGVRQYLDSLPQG